MKALLQVFYSPGTLFGTLPEQSGFPVWVLPLILNALLILSVTWMVPHYIGRSNVARQQARMLKMNPEQTEQMVKRSNEARSETAGYVVSVLGSLLYQVMVAGALLAFALMSRRPPTFPAVLSLVTLAMFPYYLVVAGMTLLILSNAPDPPSLNSLNLIATNPAAYLDPNSLGKGVYGLLSSLDALSLGQVGLMGYGFAKLTRSSLFAGLGAVGALWVLYLSVKILLSLMF